METESEFDLDAGNRTAEEYGGGQELTATGYLVFGLLTLWIYTAVRYYHDLTRHFQNRLNHFSKQLESIKVSEKDSEALRQLKESGFKVSPKIKYICVTLNAFSIILLVINMAVRLSYSWGIFDEIVFYGFNYILLLGSAASFCVSSILFLTWVCKTTRNHEYHELLLAKYIQDPSEVRLIAPSKSFADRWNRYQNQIALFLILSIPIIFLPAFAAQFFNDAIDRGEDVQTIVLKVTIGYFIIFVCAGIFHLFGIKILMNMYNNHLRIEIGCLEHLQQSHKWVGGDSLAVLKNPAETSAKGPTEQLAPVRLLAAIMLTDMVGYSKSMERDEDATYKKLQDHNAIVRKVIPEYRGQEIKTIGDAFLVRFNSASDAVQAAREIQYKFSEYNGGKPDAEQIWLRIGIHIGDILVMENDVFGTGVNIAARIEPLAEPGGICISADVYNVIKKSIDIKVISLGKKELKNISDAPEIYKLLLK